MRRLSGKTLGQRTDTRPQNQPLALWHRSVGVVLGISRIAVELFFQQLLNGLTVGGVYSLVALGLTLVYGILHVPNFAHGAFYMTGAFAGYYLMAALGLNYWIAMAGAAAVVALIAMLAERLVFHPLRNAPELHDMIAAIGILLFLEAGV